jgi:hypothetical protein
LSKRIRNPDNLEYIAKDLAVYDPKNITIKDLLLYGQILEVLRIAEVCTVPHNIIEEWATKLLAIDANPGSFNLQRNVNEEETTKKETKIDKTEKVKEAEKKEIAMSEKEERNQEQASKKEEINQDLKRVIGQMKELSISITQQSSSSNSQDTVSEMSVVSTTKKKTSSKEKQAEEDQETSIDNRIYNLKKNIEDIDKKMIELKAKEKNQETLTLTDTIENSQWSPKNRICDKSKSFKANIPTYIVLGENK